MYIHVHVICIHTVTICHCFFSFVASGASERASQRERSELKLAEASGRVPETGTRLTKKQHIGHTTHCTYHRLKAVHKTKTKLQVLGTANRGNMLEEGSRA